MKIPFSLITGLYVWLGSGCNSHAPRLLDHFEGHSLCLSEPFGDASKSIEFVILSGLTDPHPLRAEEDLELLENGSLGLALSVRARNLDRCAVSFIVRLEDQTDGSFEVNGTFAELGVLVDDSWVQPQSATRANITTFEAAPQHPYRILAVVEDSAGRQARVESFTKAGRR